MKKLIVACAVAGLAAFGLAAPAQAAPPLAAAQNHETYWENLGYGDCTKVELADGIGSYTLPSVSYPLRYSLLVLKAGSGADANDLVSFPTAGVAYTHDTDKDISHIIYCTVTQRS